MLIRRPPDLPSREITSEGQYQNRRTFLASLGALGVALAPGERRGIAHRLAREAGWQADDDTPTPYETVTTYNNYYELGTDKDEPAVNARTLKLRPWKVRIDGEVARPADYDLDDLVKPSRQEERIYRMRCVEGWSAVIPWVGIPLNELIKRCDVTGNAKFVEFWSLADPEQMPYVRLPVLDWPYVEALRLDEAMHPLALLGLGMYGEHMPKQNGAPLRVVVPWKYGFKGAKSIVKVRFVEKQPPTVWTKTAPDEYGFYSNVNPDVPHKRWSQSHERPLGQFFKRKTLPFNGYADQVAGLYAGMDLRRNF